MLSSKNFSIVNALRFGFLTYLEHFVFFLKVIVIQWSSILLTAVLTILLPLYLIDTKKIYDIGKTFQLAFLHDLLKGYLIKSDGIYSATSTFSWPLLMIPAIILIALGSFFWLGTIAISFDFYDKGHSTIKKLFSCKHLVMKSMAAFMIYIIAVLFGLFFFIIPGIYIAITYGFFNYSLVYRNTGIIESFKESVRLTQGSKLDLCALSFIITVFQSAILQLSFFALPISALIYAQVYRTLLENSLNTTHKN